MKFMNREDYQSQRNALLTQAQDAINNSDADTANKLMQDVTELDNAFEAWAQAKANLAALNKSGVAVTNAIPLSSASMDTNSAVTDVKDEGIKSDSYRSAWIHAMKGNKLTDEERKILDKVSDSANMQNVETIAGGHTLVIPEHVRKGIWEAAKESHPVLQDIAPTFIQGDIVIIKDTSKDSDADWTDEQTPSKDAEFSEGSLNLTGCELCKSVTISWKLKKMNDQDYEAYLIRRLGEKVGNTIAKALFKGKGKPGDNDSFKPQAKGVITTLEAEKDKPHVLEYTGNITYKDMTSLMAAIKSAYKAGASIYARNTTIWNQLANIIDGNKRPLFVPDVTAGGVGRIFGVPVKEEDGVDEGEVVIGNYKAGYVFNFNETMSVYQEDHVKLRQTDYMAYGIADGDVLTTDAFAMLKVKATA